VIVAVSHLVEAARVRHVQDLYLLGCCYDCFERCCGIARRPKVVKYTSALHIYHKTTSAGDEECETGDVILLAESHVRRRLLQTRNKRSAVPLLRQSHTQKVPFRKSICRTILEKDGG